MPLPGSHAGACAGARTVSAHHPPATTPKNGGVLTPHCLRHASGSSTSSTVSATASPVVVIFGRFDKSKKRRRIPQG